MAKTITVEVEAPKNLKAGEKFSIEVELPTPEKETAWPVGWYCAS